MTSLVRCGLNWAGVAAVVALTVAGAGPARAGTVYVSSAGSDASNGLSWATAKKTVQAGLNAAASGDQVWVKAGTYIERITLKAGAGLYGGFAGSETDLLQRNWTANITILDGNQAGSVVTAPSGATTTTRIDGFTIRNSSGTSGSFGGGIYCSASSPTIANNTISGNFAQQAGGGIYCSSSSGIISNNIITGNGAQSNSGGGIYCSASSLTISNNTITNNIANSGGGGICCSSSTATITNNTISGNKAYSLGGGGIYCSGGSSTITSNTIMNNSVPSSGGGGIYISSKSGTITNNAIGGNSAFTYGGGINCSGGATIANNVITGNGVVSLGGGIYFGGAMYGGGPAPIVNNTVVGNSGGSGGGIAFEGSATISNTIVAYNSSGIYAMTDLGGTPNLRYNCVYGNADYNYADMADPTGTNGNISVDPKLADLLHANIHIQPDSPCRDAGDDSAVQGGWTDMDGQARTLGTHADIGVDESDGTMWAKGPYAIVRVSPAGNDANDGSSWAKAKRTVQAGLDAAAAAGGEVWVQEGVYPWPQTVTLRAWMHFYGGFGGTETQRSQRNWSSHPTVLDGNNISGVVTASNGGYRISTIDGFTIRNGHGGSGGGINCTNSSPVISNNIITGNTAISTGYLCGGGGIYCDFGSWPYIINDIIKGNRGDNGGGVCACASSTIVNTIIVGNIASTSGGGIFCGSSGSIVNCTITSNSASAGGGGIICEGSLYPTIANSIVAFNTSGIYNTGSGAPSLDHSCVYGNTAYDFSGMADPTGTNGNISGDPKFVRRASPGVDGVWGTADDDYGDLHLLSSSPCIDAGSNADLPPDITDLNGNGNTTEPLPQDLDRKPRGAGSTTPPIVDMGAYEYALPAPFHVSPAGNDANDGLTWATAKQTVRAGLNAAAAGDQVWVSAGTYVENTTLSFGVGLYGGFAASETDLAQRNIAANATILDGNQAGSVVTVPVGALKDTRIDGFVIRNGKAATGGGINCISTSPTIANNTIADNTATSTGGAIACSSSSVPLITGNTITGNTATSTGGAIACSSSSPAVITGNTISGNSAPTGGGVYSFMSSVVIVSNTITANSAPSGGGGIRFQGLASPTVADNLIAGNSGSVGGGIYCNSCPPTIAGNTIVANRATGNPAYGGGIFCVSSSPMIVNSIIALNSTGIASIGTGAPSLRYNCVYGNVAYNYSGVADPTGTNGNISADPLFVSASPGADGIWGTADDTFTNLHLLPGSPCIDAGSNADVPADSADLNGNGNMTEPLPFDLAGAGRFADDPDTADTGTGTAPIVDIGAYEYHCGDASGDGHVDVLDLLDVVYSFGTVKGDAAYDPTCDFNHDGAVDVVDLLDLVYNFGT